MLSILIVLVIVGFALYLLNLLVPLDPRIKQAIVAIVLLCTFLYIVGILTGHSVAPGLWR